MIYQTGTSGLFKYSIYEYFFSRTNKFYKKKKRKKYGKFKFVFTILTITQTFNHNGNDFAVRVGQCKHNF